MKAQVKCSYADLYYKDTLYGGFVKLKTNKKFGKKTIIGQLNGIYKTHGKRDYLQLESVNGFSQKNYFWVKKVAVNIIEENDEPIFKEEQSDKKNSNILLPIALLLTLFE